MKKALIVICVVTLLSTVVPYGVVTALLNGWCPVPVYDSVAELQSEVSKWTQADYRYSPLENPVSEAIDRFIIRPLTGRHEFINCVREPWLLAYSKTCKCAFRGLFIACVVEDQGLGKGGVVWGNHHAWAVVDGNDVDVYPEHEKRLAVIRKEGGTWYRRYPMKTMIDAYYILTRAASWMVIALCLQGGIWIVSSQCTAKHNSSWRR